MNTTGTLDLYKHLQLSIHAINQLTLTTNVWLAL